MKKRIALLGASGSIGRQTLEVIRANPNAFELFGVSIHQNIKSLKQLIREFPLQVIVITGETPVPHFPSIKILQGKKGLEELASHPKVDVVVVATSGTIGIFPTLAALDTDKRVALANKETLVSFGPVVKKKLTQSKGEIIPIDSEHSALFQLVKNRENEVNKLILTASGGPFRNLTLKELQNVKVEDALRHPTWQMGKKITVDSATLMNKGLEVIEAHWLFGFPPEKIEVLIHPQSIVHGLVELKDGSFLAHLGYPDMRIPIQYALSYSQRLSTAFSSLGIKELSQLEFFSPDLKRFPLLQVAYKVLEVGGSMTCVMNRADEEAVYAFLNRRISYLQISEVVERIIERHSVVKTPNLETLLKVDSWARDKAREFVLFRTRLSSKG